MKIPLFLKKIYYKIPLPNCIEKRISGRIFSKKFNEEIRWLQY